MKEEMREAFEALLDKEGSQFGVQQYAMFCKGYLAATQHQQVKIDSLQAALSAVPANHILDVGKMVPPAPTMSQFANKADYEAALQSQAQQPEQEPVKQEPYAYDVPTEDGTELAYAIYFTKYGRPIPEGAIPLYLEAQP
jgi:hypothetical protein